MEKYKGLSAAQFFYRNREIAGFSNPVRALYQSVRELVENSLDATETHGILPEIYLKIDVDKDKEDRIILEIEDNGIGIPGREIPNVFGRVFYGSKYTLRQTRGVFGLGVKMAVLYAQITTGMPIYIKSSTLNSSYIYEYEIQIDIEKNIPIIKFLKITKKKNRKQHGTKARLITMGNLKGAHRRIEEYIKRTALIAPYANIVFKTPKVEYVFKRVVQKLPTPPKVGKYHPKGVDIELLKMMIRKTKRKVKLVDFLSNNFDGVGKRTALNFCKWCGIDPNLEVKNLSVSMLELLSSKMREYPKWRRPRPITLSPVGEKLLKEGARRILNPEFVTAVTRPPASYSGNPFIVEVALAWGGDIQPQNTPILYRFANRIPLLYDEGADVARKIIDSIDWNIYKVKFPARIVIITHLCSTKVPFKGVGKEAIADVPEVEKELNIAIREAARRLRRHLSKVEKAMELKRRRVIIEKYIGEVSRALAYICKMEDKIFLEKLSAMLRSDIEKRVLVRNVEA